MLEHCNIVYINLAHRTDRRAEAENELDKIGATDWTRFEAIPDADGSIGCSMSHLAVLETYVPTKDLLMIMEDDCEFIVDRKEIDDVIRHFVCSNASVLCLAYNARQFSPIDEKIQRAYNTQTHGCYIMKPSIRPIIKSTFVDSISMLQQGMRRNLSCGDRVWFREQERYIWAVPINRAARQRASYSDIEKRMVDYGV
jgi:GR25 family glycosyltransferase involved in LPS biosynthesis